MHSSISESRNMYTYTLPGADITGQVVAVQSWDITCINALSCSKNSIAVIKRNKFIIKPQYPQDRRGWCPPKSMYSLAWLRAFLVRIYFTKGTFTSANKIFMQSGTSILCYPVNSHRQWKMWITAVTGRIETDFLSAIYFMSSPTFLKD